MSDEHDGRSGSNTAEDIRAYIRRLMATRPEPTPNQTQTGRGLLLPSEPEQQRRQQAA